MCLILNCLFFFKAREEQRWKINPFLFISFKPDSLFATTVQNFASPLTSEFFSLSHSFLVSENLYCQLHSGGFLKNTLKSLVFIKHMACQACTSPVFLKWWLSVCKVLPIRVKASFFSEALYLLWNSLFFLLNFFAGEMLDYSHISSVSEEKMVPLLINVLE